MALAAVMTAYVFWRLGSATYFDRLSWPVRLGGGLFVWLMILLGRQFGHGRGGTFGPVVELVGMDLLVVVFLAFILLLATDVITGCGVLMPRLAPILRGAAVAAALILSVTAVVQGVRDPVITEYEVTLPGLPEELDGTVVAGLSDLHIGSQLGEEWLEDRIRQTLDMNPDMVVLLGDIFEGHSDLRHLLPLMRTLRAPLGVYAVQGNHERFGREFNPLGLMADAGYTVLFNRWASPVQGLTVAGVEDLTIHTRNGALNDPVTKALDDRPEGATLLLSHTPLRMETAARQSVGLMLSGHTHGGQIWPFGYLVKLRYPLLEGSMQVGPMTAIVCRGTGMWGPRMRLFKPGEILRITLRAPDSDE